MATVIILGFRPGFAITAAATGRVGCAFGHTGIRVAFLLLLGTCRGCRLGMIYGICRHRKRCHWWRDVCDVSLTKETFCRWSSGQEVLIDKLCEL